MQDLQSVQQLQEEAGYRLPLAGAEARILETRAALWRLESWLVPVQVGPAPAQQWKLYRSRSQDFILNLTPPSPPNPPLVSAQQEAAPLKLTLVFQEVGVTSR